MVDTKTPKKPGKPYLPPKSFLCGPHFFLQRKVLRWSRAVYAFFFPADSGIARNSAVGIKIFPFNRREDRRSLAIFFAEEIAHLGALKIARFCGGAVKIAAATAENRAILVHSASPNLKARKTVSIFWPPFPLYARASSPVARHFFWRIPTERALYYKNLGLYYGLASGTLPLPRGFSNVPWRKRAFALWKLLPATGVIFGCCQRTSARKTPAISTRKFLCQKLVNSCPTLGQLLASRILYTLLVGEKQHEIARARFCTQSCSKVGQLLVNSSPTPHPSGSCRGLPCSSPLATPDIWALRAQSWKKSPKMSSWNLSAPGSKKLKTESKKELIIRGVPWQGGTGLDTYQICIQAGFDTYQIPLLIYTNTEKVP